MNDGNIIRDEETRLGEVSKVPKEEEKKEVMDLEEEDLANVSAIMSEIPDAQPQAPQRKKPIKKARSLPKRKRNRKAKGVVRR
jgi:hypothetical protein